MSNENELPRVGEMWELVVDEAKGELVPHLVLGVARVLGDRSDSRGTMALDAGRAAAAAHGKEDRVTCPRCDEGMGPYRSPAERSSGEEPARSGSTSVDRFSDVVVRERRTSFREACDYGALVTVLVFAALLGLGMLLEKAHPGPGPLEKIKARESAADAGVPSPGGR